MVTVTIHKEDILINGQVGERIGFEIKGSIAKFISSFKILY